MYSGGNFKLYSWCECVGEYNWRGLVNLYTYEDDAINIMGVVVMEKMGRMLMVVAIDNCQIRDDIKEVMSVRLIQIYS